MTSAEGSAASRLKRSSASLARRASIALLASNDTKTVSLLQLDYMVDGRWEDAAVISVVVMLVTTGAAFIARICGLRLGMRS